MPTLNQHEECCSDLVLDSYFAGDLAQAARLDLEAHLEQCARCGLRRDALLAQRVAFLARVPSWESLAPTPTPRLALRVIGLGSATLAAAAALLLIALPKAPSLGVRSKGRAQLGVFIKHDGHVARAQQHDRVRPGDLLRLTYSTATRSELAVLHRDARTASIYYPLAGQTVSVEPGRDVALDFSIRFDAEPGEERLYGLFCAEPTPLEPLRAALEATGRLPPLPDCQIDNITLIKQLEDR